LKIEREAMTPLAIPRNRDSLVALVDKSGIILLFAGMFLLLSIFVPYFFTWVNMVGLALSVSMIGMGACTMMFCLAAGDIDLSIEAVVAVSGVFTAVLINRTHSIAVGITGGIALGALVGLVNGFIVARFRVNALIVTLAIQQVLRGVGFIISGGSAIGISEQAFFTLGNGYILGVPNPVWIMIACFTVFGTLLKKTTYGKNTLALGGSREAVHLAGIDVRRVEITVFLLEGVVGGFAGIVLASRMTSGQPNASTGFSMDCISACVLGGVSLNGGVATISGAVVGVLIMGTLQNAMNLLNIPTFYQYVARGAILLAAVLYDQAKRSRSQS
jgi:L-arabinose transport system permease protein